MVVLEVRQSITHYMPFNSACIFDGFRYFSSITGRIIKVNELSDCPFIVHGYLLKCTYKTQLLVMKPLVTLLDMIFLILAWMEETYEMMRSAITSL